MEIYEGKKKETQLSLSWWFFWDFMHTDCNLSSAFVLPIFDQSCCSMKFWSSEADAEPVYYYAVQMQVNVCRGGKKTITVRWYLFFGTGVSCLWWSDVCKWMLQNHEEFLQWSDVCKLMFCTFLNLLWTWVSLLPRCCIVWKTCVAYTDVYLVLHLCASSFFSASGNCKFRTSTSRTSWG